MKLKFIKLLAAVGAATLVMGATALAAPSPGSGSASPSTEPSSRVYYNVPTTASFSGIEKSAGLENATARVYGGRVILAGTYSGNGGTVRIPSDSIVADGNYKVLRRDANGNWVEVKIVKKEKGALTVEGLGTNEEIVVLQLDARGGVVTSPKTGQGTSVALMTALFALAGAVVFVRKYSFSR